MTYRKVSKFCPPLTISIYNRNVMRIDRQICVLQQKYTNILIVNHHPARLPVLVQPGIPSFVPKAEGRALRHLAYAAVAGPQFPRNDPGHLINSI